MTASDMAASGAAITQVSVSGPGFTSGPGSTRGPGSTSAPKSERGSKSTGASKADSALNQTGGALAEETFVHRTLPSGLEFAADLLPQRGTVALVFRLLAGVGEDPPELTGLGHMVERTLSKGTRRYDGPRAWPMHSTRSGRNGRPSAAGNPRWRACCACRSSCRRSWTSSAKMLVRPTFPDDACRVAVELALQERKHLEDDPADVLRLMIQRLTLGPVLGRNPGGELDTLPRITPELVPRTLAKAVLRRAAAGRGRRAGRCGCTRGQT